MNNLWLISVVLCIMSGYAWAYHDCYFWDKGAKEYVKKVWKDWHNLKSFMLATFIFSCMLIPWTWHHFIAWLFIRWASFEFFMFYGTRDKPYKVNLDWWGGKLFEISKRKAIIVMIVFSIAPIIYEALK